MTPTKWVNLYNKYRPTCFDEVVGQNHIVRTLQNAVNQNRVANAYLFRGPKGSGKTSTARILCRAANCLTGTSCGACEGCSGAMRDVLEIDAASHRGIDNITELIETLRFRPKFVDKKFVIIDEAHQLTSASLNALLKIVEEPPPYIHFIFCTTQTVSAYWSGGRDQRTETEKAFVTLSSRCQTFAFNKIASEEILVKLHRISVSEDRNLSDDVLRSIVGRSDGSLRDAENILESVLLWDNEYLNVGIIQLLYGDIAFLSVELFRNCCLGNITDGLDDAHHIWENGGSPGEVADLCLGFVSNIIQLKAGCEVYCPSDIVGVLQEISENVERKRLESVAVAFSGLKSSNQDSVLALELAVYDSINTPSEALLESELVVETTVLDAKLW